MPEEATNQVKELLNRCIEIKELKRLKSKEPMPMNVTLDPVTKRFTEIRPVEKPPPIALTEADENTLSKEIRRLYWEEELSVSGVAERLGVSRGVIWALMYQYEIPRRRTWVKLDPGEIRRLYWEEELSLSAVAERLGVGSGSIVKIMRQYEIPTRTATEVQVLLVKLGKHRISKVRFDPEEIRRLYWDEELSQPDVAKRLGKSSESVSAFMRRNGIPRRSHAEAMTLAAKSGKNNPRDDSQFYNWEGRRWKDRKGYVHILLHPDNPYYCMAKSDGSVSEHRLVMAKHLGRPLESWEIVHHINGIKSDNRIENLKLTTNKEHPSDNRKTVIELQKRVTILEAELILVTDREMVLALQEQVEELQSRVTILEAENIFLRTIEKGAETILITQTFTQQQIRAERERIGL